MRARSGIASTTFFFAESRIFMYIFFAVVCDVFSARSSVTFSRSSATSSDRAMM